MTAAGKFDDVVLIQDGKYMGIQSKHKMNAMRITLDDLKKHKDFKLSTYFSSYFKMKTGMNDWMKTNHQPNSSLGEVILFTNALIEDDLIKGPNKIFEKIPKPHEIFNYSTHPKNEPAIYQLIDATKLQQLGITGGNDKDKKEFVDHFRLAANQPDRHELTRYMKDLLTTRYQEEGIIDIDRIYGRIEDEMISWYEEKDGRFLTHNDASDILEPIKSN